ncbi:MAG: S8 family serine peptidase [Gammaproteobacteria bacterium]|nr:S8 family serine peptidase [Gammaproteobacteria bacterium]
MEVAPSRTAALAVALLAGACGGGGGSGDKPPPPPPVTLTLNAPSQDRVLEADNPQIEITVTASSSAHRGVTAGLTISGSATRGHDYALDADSIELPGGASSASLMLDVYRDFDAEGDETVTVDLGTITGNASLGTPSTATWTIVDGEAATVDKTPSEPEGDGFLVLVSYQVTEDSVDFELEPFDFSTDGAMLELIAEYSGDADFATDVNPLGRAELAGTGRDGLVFFNPYRFTLPLDRVAGNGQYHIRAYLAHLGPDSESAIHFRFATDADGQVVTRCRAPVRGAASGADPLLVHQWHLRNTGQTGLSERAGVAGADLRMREAIENGRSGGGVKLAVVDSGLEICHPDLAANIEPGKSFNFGRTLSAGASLSDPFNHFEAYGDHGTSVAGVAAAVADNGAGGRGVAPALRLRGFNFLTGQGWDSDGNLLASLGGSDASPDSASADIFNMSFGAELPAGNAEPDFVELYRMGVTDLRSGSGALYVKAAGNEFQLCQRPHPLNADIGCIGSNGDPDNNLPYLVTVGAFNAQDVKSSYSNAGANLWVVAPAGEDSVGGPGMITTDQFGVEAGLSRFFDDPLDGHALNPDGDYTAAFSGTSSAAPATAGAIAVLLGVNPQLTWRDVKHILAKTARRIDPDRPQVRAAFNGTPYVAQHAWQTNSAGYGFHNWYGFGAVSLDAAVAMAGDYAPDSLGAFVESGWYPEGGSATGTLAIPDADGGGVTDTLTITGLPDAANLEGVLLEIRVEHAYASDLGVTLTSPGGTESVVNAPMNALLDQVPGMTDWRLLSNAFYGETPNGEWKIQVVDLAGGDVGSLNAWRLRFYYGDHPARTDPNGARTRPIGKSGRH